MQYAVQAFRGMQSVSLLLEASDLSDAHRLAASQGLAIIEVKPVRGQWLRGSGSSRGFPLLQFTQSLLILLKAGLSVVECIETLVDRETRSEARQVLVKLREHLAEGLSLSVAMERQAAVFPQLYIAGVRANERTGGLTEALERFIAYRSQAEHMRKRIVGASIYPAMILGVGALVIGFLLFYVVPRFSLVFQDLGDRIPFMSRLLLDWGRFAHAHGVEMLATGAALMVLLGSTLKRPAARDFVARCIRRLPRVGEHVRTYELARFYRALGMLQQAGIPIMAALDMVIGLLPPSLHVALARARREIGEGRPISDALEAHGLTTAVSLRLLRVAERTGQVGEMLERAARFHDEDVSQAIDWFIRLFEPLLMIGIGIVIGVVVLLMYAPIFELAGSLQ